MKAHASVIKAAAVVGIGRRNYIEMGRVDDAGRALDFDLERLEARMAANEATGKKSIIAVGLGEVNTFVSHPSLPLSYMSISSLTA